MKTQTYVTHPNGTLYKINFEQIMVSCPQPILLNYAVSHRAADCFQVLDHSLILNNFSLYAT